MIVPSSRISPGGGGVFLPVDDLARELVEDEVQVWEVGLGAGGGRWEGRDVLSEAERARGEGFRTAELRVRWERGRVLLRHLLAPHAGESPAALRLDRTAAGKPYLPDHPWLHFSVSHAGDRLAVALARGSEVGIDTEPLERTLDFEALAPSVFTRRERAGLDAALARGGEPAARDHFFGLWCAKEAALKAVGTGFLLPALDAEVDLASGWVRVRSVPPANLPRRLFLYQLPTDPGWALSLAHTGRPQVRVRRFRASAPTAPAQPAGR